MPDALDRTALASSERRNEDLTMTTGLQVGQLEAALAGLEQRMGERFDTVQRRLDALDRRIDQKLAEIRAKQEEDIMLLKAMSCQLRGRVERMERRTTRGGGS